MVIEGVPSSMGNGEQGCQPQVWLFLREISPDLQLFRRGALQITKEEKYHITKQLKVAQTFPKTTKSQGENKSILN